jgi:hypothetical protein
MGINAVADGMRKRGSVNGKWKEGTRVLIESMEETGSLYTPGSKA